MWGAQERPFSPPRQHVRRDGGQFEFQPYVPSDLARRVRVVLMHTSGKPARLLIRWGFHFLSHCQRIASASVSL
eukprot:3868514-Pyramimonas_sp.AAC.1